MPLIKINNAELFYEEHGSSIENIVFAHGLLWSGKMFEKQVDKFKDSFRCITFDFRGQGRSQVAEIGYDIDTLTEDAALLIKTLYAQPCHFVGLSMGGFVGMRLAMRHPELIKSLILLGTTADIEPSTFKYKILNFIARWFGLGIVAGMVMPIMFGQKFLNDSTREKEKNELKKQVLSNDPIGITKAVEGVIGRKSIYDEIHKITAPTLIAVGDQDIATVPAKSERIHAKISDSKFIIIPGAGHTSTIEEPEAVNNAIEEFLLNVI